MQALLHQAYQNQTEAVVAIKNVEPNVYFNTLVRMTVIQRIMLGKYIQTYFILRYIQLKFVTFFFRKTANYRWQR